MKARVLIAVTHLLGIGHLARAAAIARAFAEAGHDTILASGGLPSPLLSAGDAELVQLPPVRALVDDLGTPRLADGGKAPPAYLAERCEIAARIFRSHRPDILITEHFPFGRRSLRGEYEALLHEAAEARDPVLVASSIRDILIAPDRPSKIAATHDLVASRYGLVLVHGDAALTPLEASWPTDEGLRSKIVYTGFVGTPAHLGERPDGDEVLVSGGGSAASLPLYRAALAAAAMSGRPWRILVGHGVAASDFDGLVSARPPSAAVERARRDFRDLLGRARVFVGQAGYNTVADIVAARARAVLVPFEAGHETEQRLRAEGLAARNQAILLPEARLSAASLLRAVESAATRSRPDFGAVNLDGARHSVEATVRAASRLRVASPA